MIWRHCERHCCHSDKRIYDEVKAPLKVGWCQWNSNKGNGFHWKQVLIKSELKPFSFKVFQFDEIFLFMLIIYTEAECFHRHILPPCCNIFKRIIKTFPSFPLLHVLGLYGLKRLQIHLTTFKWKKFLSVVYLFTLLWKFLRKFHNFSIIFGTWWCR
jgi:hypothetical protein